MKIVYTPHARKRMIERLISEREIEETLKNPEITTPTHRRRRKRKMKHIGTRTIDVIFEERSDYTVVITCAYIEKER